MIYYLIMNLHFALSNIFVNFIYLLKHIFYIFNKKIPVSGYKKVQIIRKYQDLYDSDCFIETGTYLGFTIGKVFNKFKKSFSIEIDNKLFERAKKIFNKNNKVKIVNGDSGKVLPKILKNNKDKILFWLDAHYSGGVTGKGDIDTPILKEIDIIAKRNFSEDVILIDDAKDFNGKNGYPRIKYFQKYINTKMPSKRFIVKEGIIRII